MKRALIVALLATSPAVAQEEDRFTNPSGITVDIDLQAIRETPEAYKSLWVRFDLQFCSMGRVSNPFFTQFVPSDFANFYGWGGSQPIWRKSSYDDLFGMLFMHKDNPRVSDLYSLRLYDRITVTGVVRNVFQDKPWIEVVDFAAQTSTVDTPTLAHLFRAETHMARREWNRAISELSMAPAGDKPAHVMAAVHKNLGICYLRIGEAEKAQSYLSQAAALAAPQDHEAARLEQIARENPRLELDTGVDRSGISDAQRPMWEAFAGEGQIPATPGFGR